MKQICESCPTGSENPKEAYTSDITKFGSNIDKANQPVLKERENEKNKKQYIAAIDFVHDHFPEDISHRDDFEQYNDPNFLKSEEYYKKIFSAFEQEELVPIYNKKTKSYGLNPQFRPFKETVNIYLHKTESMIKNLSGEDGKNPTTDVAIYLDKSARPVSWFVNELWRDFSDQSIPRTEHLAIDRKPWLQRFGVELDFGEYLKGSDKLAGWEDIPVHNVTTEDIIELMSLFEKKLITVDDIKKIMNGNTDIVSRIKGQMINTFLCENNEAIAKWMQGKITSSKLDESVTQSEYEKLLKAGTEKANQLTRILDKQIFTNVWDAFQIASQIRALFLPGGITVEEKDRPDLIMSRESGMKGKNITIIDEVERTGTTKKVATHFISWAFPEAESVRFDVFYEAKKLSAGLSHPQNGQMLMIPFWYPISHDDGRGRGIAAGDIKLYRKMYENNPNNLTRAALYGAAFLGTRIDYDSEPDKKSLRLREQIARLRIEYEKGNIG